MVNISKDLEVKLKKAANAEEVAEILKEAGADETIASQIWSELEAHRDEKELSPYELEAVSGGADREWLKEGCAATVEPGSWCDSNDYCNIWDITYDIIPEYYCPQCNGMMYYYSGGLYKCRSCNHIFYYSRAKKQWIIKDEVF